MFWMQKTNNKIKKKYRSKFRKKIRKKSGKIIWKKSGKESEKNWEKNLEKKISKKKIKMEVKTFRFISNFTGPCCAFMRRLKKKSFWFPLRSTFLLNFNCWEEHLEKLPWRNFCPAFPSGRPAGLRFSKGQRPKKRLQSNRCAAQLNTQNAHAALTS